jgi:hypothetical protein
MKLRHLMTAVAMLAAGAAGAAELTLYEEPGFGGGNLTLRGYTPSTANYGFPGAQSVFVQSGRWQICNEPEFRGQCTELVPGKYGGLDSNFNRRIASAREIGSYGNSTGGYRNYDHGIIKFFSDPTFSGRSLDMQEDTPNFRARGYNDRASSIIVAEGVWELCTDANYGGTCRRYGPGRYADLGWGMNGQISSARVVRNPHDAPAQMGGGWGRVPPNDQGASRLILFREEGLRGPSMALSGTVLNLDDVRFNDAAGSMVVEGGSWLVCSDASFRGNCRVFGPGRYDQLRDAGLARVISSARPAAPETLGRRWGGSEGVQLFSERDFGGSNRSFGSDVANLQQAGFNDRARSMVVNAGEWELCSDAAYHGRCMVVGPGSYANLGRLADSLSSLRRVR